MFYNPLGILCIYSPIKFLNHVIFHTWHLSIIYILIQALRNLVNKSVRRITTVYARLDRKMKSAAAKEAALDKMRRMNEEEDNKIGGIIQVTLVEH